MTWIDVVFEELGRIELFGAPFNYLDDVEKYERDQHSARRHFHRILGPVLDNTAAGSILEPIWKSAAESQS